jgi:hypothetical protein
LQAVAAVVVGFPLVDDSSFASLALDNPQGIRRLTNISHYFPLLVYFSETQIALGF